LEDIYWLAGIFAAWFVLQRFVLPRLGVST
jgi:hypothetical protein